MIPDQLIVPSAIEIKNILMDKKIKEIVMKTEFVNSKKDDKNNEINLNNNHKRNKFGNNLKKLTCSSKRVSDSSNTKINDDPCYNNNL